MKFIIAIRLLLIKTIYNNRYSIELFENSNYARKCFITLYPLNEKIIREDWGIIHDQQTHFSSNDYYQEYIGAVPIKNGLCTELHEFIISNLRKILLQVQTVYSSIKGVDLTDDGNKFWDAQVRKGNAGFIDQFKRYILFIK